MMATLNRKEFTYVPPGIIGCIFINIIRMPVLKHPFTVTNNKYRAKIAYVKFPNIGNQASNDMKYVFRNKDDGGLVSTYIQI